MEKLIGKYDVELAEPACGAGGSKYGAVVKLPNDISGVLPYLNAVAKASRYDHKNRILILDEPEQRYAFRAHEIRLAEAGNLLDAKNISEEIVERLNQLWQKRDSITPDFTERTHPPVMEVFRLLPGTNCRRCGYNTCMAFAAALSREAGKPEDCLPIDEDEFADSMKKLRQLCTARGQDSK